MLKKSIKLMSYTALFIIILPFGSGTVARADAAPCFIALSSTAKTDTVLQIVRSIRSVTKAAILKARTQVKKQTNSPFSFALKPKTIPCQNGGSVTIDGVATGQRTAPRSAQLDVGVTSNQCSGLDGTLELTSSVAFNNPSAQFIETISGILTGQPCGRGGTTNLEADLTFQGSLNVKTRNVYGTISGTIEITCGAFPIPLLTCNWNQVKVSDKAAIEAGCL